MDIHTSAVVDSKARIGQNVKIGPFTVVEAGVNIGDNCEIGSSVLIASGTKIGSGCRIFHGAVLGTIPQDLKFEGEESFLEIGNNTTIREFATINRGTKDRWKTIIGDNCLLMAYSHIAHDCHLGNNVIIANSVNMAGHVTIEDYVGVGGMTPIHQFVRIGRHSFVGGGLRINKDVPPFILAMGEPLRFGGLNKVGLKRRGFSDEILANIKEAYRIIYQENLTVKDALEKVEEDLDLSEELRNIISFFQESERGVIR
jgi:UDP-N-acetylglucosamine acyltransferase